ncbi:MAG: tannase/feruloyl esterase family alpha/beta hydrolase [Actinomycetota bacterium]
MVELLDGRGGSKTIALWASAFALAAAAWPASTGATERGATAPSRCRNIAKLTVPRAEEQKKDCLDDLTTAGTSESGHTNTSDWSGLHAEATRNPSGVPGIQIDGYFPDDSRTNSNNGWLHDSQFVIRLPARWNGKLVITGAPGVRRQYANDFIFADWVLARGYAFASTDKGNTEVLFSEDGADPADAVAEWHRRVTQLTRATKAVVEQRYGQRPKRTYVAGISNGGYLARWALEHHPEMYDGALDWEGTLIQAASPNLFTYLPVALRNYPDFEATGSEEARRRMLDAGFAEGSEFLWEYHYSVYWDLTQRIYREEFDPDYDGALHGGIPFCQQGTPNCDADYDYEARPQEVKEAIDRVSNSGDIGKPMMTLHGTLDALLPIETDSDVYRRMVRAAGRARLHRYYVIEDGNHVDGLYDDYPGRLRPMLPCVRAAFKALERWVERAAPPPRTRLVDRPRKGDVVNSCAIGPAVYGGSWSGR